MPEITLERAITTLVNPYNLIAAVYMLLMLAAWWSARFWQTPDFVRRRAIFLSPRWTVLLQKRFRSPFMDKFTSIVWFWGFTFTIFAMWAICLFQGERAWRIGVVVLGTVSTSLLLQALFPVVVPIRYPDFGKPMEGFEQIRFQVSERSGSIYGSDIVNGLLYNGVPSNHFGMMLVGAFICLQINWYDPWLGWWLGALMFALIASVFAFSVIYLGEHYPLDMVASAIVYPIGITVFNIILEAIIPFPAS